MTAATLRESAKRALYSLLDRLYVPLDRSFVRRTRNIQRIPREAHREGGKYSYAEWGHVIGIFQALLHEWLPQKQGNRLLDVGCGTGLLAIASEPFLGGGGYTGIDVRRADVEFCRRHYESGLFEFVHLEAHNRAYAAHQPSGRTEWPLESGSFDAVTALSVWTHFGEEDARHYLTEVARVLKPGGRAVITFFILDHPYREGLSRRTETSGRYHATPQTTWIFDQVSYGSTGWFHPRWAPVPEAAIAITEEALDALADEVGLGILKKFPGNWKELPGMYFQDVVVFEKPAAQPG